MGCSSSTTRSESGEASYYDASMNDHNQAPRSMTPPKTVDEGDKSQDPVYLRTQADYHFAVGESLSLDGQNEKAIESFKTVLIYDPESALVRMRLATEYVRVGLISQAVEQAEKSLAKNPKSVEGRLLLGGLYSTLKVYPAAVKQYEAVLKLDPNNNDALLYLGAVFAEQKQYDKAVKYFETLLKDPEFKNPYLVYYYSGRIYLEQGSDANMKKAEIAFKKALENKPDYFDAVAALATLYQKQGRRDKVIAAYKTFQKHSATNPKAAEYLAQVYMESEDYDLALEQLQIIEANSEENLNAKIRIALIYIEKKEYPVAIQKLNEVLAQAPDADKVRFYLAAVYEESKDFPNAINEYAKVPEASPYYGESVVHGAYLLKVLKHSDEAIDVVKKGLEVRKDIPQLYSLYASLLDEKKDYVTAQTMLKGAVEKFPENTQIRFFYGTILDRLGKTSETIDAMKEVLEIDKNHVQALNYLAFTYAEQNMHLDEAESLAKQALASSPDDGFVLDTMGWIQFKRGKPEVAVRYLETAQAKQPQESIIAEHLGDVYFRLQLTQKAKVMYEKAAEIETDQKKQKEIRAKISSTERQLFKNSDRAPASVSEPAPDMR